MKLGFVSAIVPEMTFEQVVDFASGQGFACVEMMCWPQGKAERRYGGVTHINMDDFDAGKAAYVSDYCLSKQVELSAVSWICARRAPSTQNMPPNTTPTSNMRASSFSGRQAKVALRLPAATRRLRCTVALPG